MQQNDGTRPELTAHARSDLVRRDARIRVPHAEGQTEHRVAETSRGDAHERIAIPVGRAEAARASARRADDQLVRALELLADPARSLKGQLAMPQGVVADLVSPRGDLAGHCGKAAHVLAHKEEGRGHIRGREGVENRPRSGGVGAIIKGEGGYSLAGGAPAPPAPPQGAVWVGGARGPPPPGGAAGGGAWGAPSGAK